jgi:hypothetical protein
MWAREGGTNAARSTAMGRTTDTIKGHVKKAAEKVQKKTDRTAEKVKNA